MTTNPATRTTPEPTEPPLEALVTLLHHRWTLPVLAEIYRHDGAKFVTLANRLGLSRDSLSRTLGHLHALGLAIKNPGYGHALRPEYVLTPAGQIVASSAWPLLEHATRTGHTDVLLKKWSLPTLAATGHGQHRFTDLLAALPGATPRALTLALQDLERAALLERGGNTPTDAGVRLLAHLEPLLGSLGAGL